MVFSQHCLICALWLTVGRDVWFNLSPYSPSFYFLKDTFLPLGSTTAFCLHLSYRLPFHCLGCFFLQACACMSLGTIPSTDTLSTHPGDLNSEASSDEPCSHDARLCLSGSAYALIIPSEQSCLLFLLQLEMHVCVSCVCLVCMCLCVESSHSSAHHIFSQFFSVRDPGRQGLGEEWVGSNWHTHGCTSLKLH